MKNVKVYVPFAKKDDEKKLVSGYASTEALDSQGDVVEKQAIIKALPGYLGDISPVTGKYTYGNIREMHQPSAVGKTIKADVNKKGLKIDAKVVDKEAWNKVKEGVYSGFSIGGKVMRRIGNRVKDVVLKEISLVDRPANPEALFTMVKFDGEVAMANKEDGIPQSHKDMVDAGRVLNMARELRWTWDDFKRSGRNVKRLERALEELRKLAIQVLTGSDVKKFNAIFADEEMLKGDMEIKQTPHLEVMDAGYILELAAQMRGLMSIFQHEGKSTVELNRAIEQLKKLAVKLLTKEEKKKFDQILYGMDFEELDLIYFGKKKLTERDGLQTTETTKKTDISQYINNNWSPGYFEQMRKVIG